MKKDNFIQFNDRWVVVSGASSGIGKAIVHQLYGLGAKVVLIGRDEQRLEATADGIPGDSYEKLTLDLTDIDAIQPALKGVKEKVGKIYGLCHSAGAVKTLPLSASNNTVSADMMQINFFAGLELARSISRRDIGEDSGSIVFISSIYALVGAPGQTAYCASKGAVASSVKAMAVELSRRKIRVNSISPGFVHTKMTEGALSQLNEQQLQAIIEKHPLGPGTPEEVARTVAFLLAPENKWITGADFVVDGGYTAL